MTPDQKTFGERLAAARRTAGLTQDQLGEAARVGGAAISAWEKGRNQPSSSQLGLVCDRLGVSADVLLGRSEARA